MAMTKFTDHKEFVEEAKRRGLQVLTHPPVHEGPHEDDMHQPTHVGVRQHNPRPDYPGDKFIDMEYGVGQLELVEGSDNAWEFVGYLFDTDEEFEAWHQEQQRLAYEAEQIEYAEYRARVEDSEFERH